jgi:protein-S-isoprenylcysteine O-methyltransferase Ste14
MSADAVATDRAGTASAWSRWSVLLYGIGSYLIGVAALVFWIVIMLGLVPFGLSGFRVDGTAAQMTVNVALLVAFGLQHSVMARKGFKEKWTRIVHPAAERATYLVATGVFLIPVCLLWQPMSSTVWSVETPMLARTISGLAVVGWTYLFLASFAIDHFELFGLRQVYEHFRGRGVSQVPFKERWMYRFDRHPIMTGALIGMWATPEMTLGHLVFAAGFSAYIVIGVYFEERALRRQWGEAYDDYRGRVKSLVPTF